jgi:hypothetical protein
MTPCTYVFYFGTLEYYSFLALAKWGFDPFHGTSYSSQLVQLLLAIPMKSSQLHYCRAELNISVECNVECLTML